MFIIKKIHLFFINFRQFHFVYLTMFALLYYVRNWIFSIDNFNNSCYELIQNKAFYCSFFSDVTFYILTSEIIIYWIIALSLSSLAIWVKKNNGKLQEGYFLYLLVPYILFRIFTSKPSDNSFINFFNEYYYLVWEYWFWILIIMFVLFIVISKDDFILKMSTKQDKNPLKEIESNNDDNSIENIIKISLPPIISKILYTSFKKVSLDSEWNKRKGLFSIKEIIKESDEEYFVVFDLHDDLFESLTSLANYKWSLGIESFGNIKWFTNAKWKSKTGKNGIVLNIHWKRIDMSWLFKFPELLIDTIPNKPLEFKIWISERWIHLSYNLAVFPHLLVASETWGWKSVSLTNILVSFMKNKLAWSPIQFFIVDPKKVEFSIFEGLAWFKITTSIDKWLNMSKWLVAEMLRRYDLLKNIKVKNITEYQDKGFSMDYIVFVVDEFADIMTSGWDTGKEFENSIVRLTQLARAVWIHVILATQNPIWEVITSNIKANMTSRLWLRTSDAIKSRTIIDSWVLADIKYKWEWYIKTWEWIEHIKSYYIDNETELADFIAYYKQKTKGKKKTNESQTNLLKDKKEGVPVHLEELPTILNDFNLMIDEWEFHIDKYSISYIILNDLIKNWWYSSKDSFYEKFRIHNIPKRIIEKLISELKEKKYIKYSESEKINKIVPSLDVDFLNELYLSIYLIIQR